jgi:streptogramin lyase
VHAPIITEFSGLRPHGVMECMAVGPDGNFWITDSFDQDTGTSLVLRVDPNGRETGRFYYGYISVFPNGGDITAGPDGALWIADTGDGNLVRMTVDGKFTLFRAFSPNAVTPGPDGNVWFTTAYGSPYNFVGKITPRGQITAYTNGLTGDAEDISAGPDGALWFTEFEGKIGRVTTDGKITEYSMGIPSGSNPSSITSGPDGNLWFTEPSNSAIGRITTSGVVTLFTKGITGGPDDIATGRSEALWFTEGGGDRIGRIETNGQINEYRQGISPHAFPGCIVKGPDANMWFTEIDNHAIARVTL